MKDYSFSPQERRAITAALEFCAESDDIRTRLSDYEKATLSEQFYAVLARFADDNCWDKIEGEEK